MGVASLESLTNELFEQVVQYLDLHDIRNVRLASRSTALKAVQDTYQSYFRNKHVELGRKSLQSFVDVTSQSGVGCLVENLSLIGIVYDAKDLESSIETGRPQRKMGSSRKIAPSHSAEELEATKQDLDLLRRRREDDKALREEGSDLILVRKAFSNIALSKRSPLKSLSLGIKIHRGDTVKPTPSSLWEVKQVFQAATCTYWLTVESLRSSQLRIEALDIFFNIPEQLKSSLPCDDLASSDLSSTGRLGPCLSTLKTLSVSITDPLVDETEYDTRDTGDGADDFTSSRVERRTPEVTHSSRDRITNEENYSALFKMLRLCPSLEELNLVGYQLNHSDMELAELQKTMRSRHIYHIARARPLTHLRKLNLANLRMHDADLLTLLRSHISTLRELELTDIWIPERSFPSIVSYATGEETGFEAIRFENIREGEDLIHFQCDWEEEGIDSFDRDDVVRKWGIERKGDIAFFGREIGLMGCSTVFEWTLEERILEEENMSDL